MLKILVYTDGTPAAQSALRFAAQLKKRCQEAELAVITVRSGTHAAEEPPPVGREIALTEAAALPVGLQILVAAMETLVAQSVLERPPGITLSDMSKGHMFVSKGLDGARIPFYESFGPFVETLNREVDEHGYDLLIIAPPQRGKLGRIVRGDTTRKLALDLHTSLLAVRGGGPESRYLVCADGSVAARRQFPMLRLLLPAIGPPVDLMCVREPNMDAQKIQAAQECLQHARDWLGACGKQGAIVMKEGSVPAEEILDAAGKDTVIVMGASLRHDVYRRMLGSLPMQIMARTAASVLLVKRPPEAGDEYMKDPLACR
jgi:nucleotide-binding universal stress UspA family protein